jgi:hypothetical protein
VALAEPRLAGDDDRPRAILDLKLVEDAGDGVRTVFSESPRCPPTTIKVARLK